MGKKVRVAIVGVGNCASSLVQGVEFYKDAGEAERVPGLMHVNFGGYHIRDIEFTAAFDVNAEKVGRDLSEAIFARPNNTYRFCDVPHLGVPLYRGMAHDERGNAADDIVSILKFTKTDVVINYLPAGAESATEWYTEQILEAGCGMVNCVPVFIASSPFWSKRFEDANLPIIGDDIKSQVGATSTRRVLANLFRERGVRLDRTYQLNSGASTDFINMLEREPLESGRNDQNRIGTSDDTPWFEDQKSCYIRMEGTTFGNVPLKCEVKLEVWDSPNSAGVVIDAVRCAKLALDRGMGGPLTAASSYFMKSPPQQVADHQARALVEAFIKGDRAVAAESPASPRDVIASRQDRRVIPTLIPKD